MRSMRNSVLLKVHVPESMTVHLPSFLAWTTVPREQVPVKSLEYEYKDGRLVEITGRVGLMDKVNRVMDKFGFPTSVRCSSCNVMLQPDELIKGVLCDSCRDRQYGRTN